MLNITHNALLFGKVTFATLKAKNFFQQGLESLTNAPNSCAEKE